MSLNSGMTHLVVCTGKFCVTQKYDYLIVIDFCHFFKTHKGEQQSNTL